MFAKSKRFLYHTQGYMTLSSLPFFHEQGSEKKLIFRRQQLKEGQIYTWVYFGCSHIRRAVHISSHSSMPVQKIPAGYRVNEMAAAAAFIVFSAGGGGVGKLAAGALNMAGPLDGDSMTQHLLSLASCITTLLYWITLRPHKPPKLRPSWMNVTPFQCRDPRDTGTKPPDCFTSRN